MHENDKKSKQRPIFLAPRATFFHQIYLIVLSVGPKRTGNDDLADFPFSRKHGAPRYPLFLDKSTSIKLELSENFSAGFTLLGKTIQQGLKKSIRFILELPKSIKTNAE